MLRRSRFRKEIRGRPVWRVRRRRTACETHRFAVHSARLVSCSMLLVALIVAAAGSEGLRGTPASPDAAGPRYRVLWKNGAVDTEALADPAAEGRRLLAEGKSRILIQFRGKPDAADLHAGGIELLRYIPSDTWIARVSEGTDWNLVASTIRWLGEIPASVKISAAVGAEIEGKRAGVIPVRVRFHDDVDLGEAAALIRNAGGIPVAEHPVSRGFDAILPVPAAETLAERDEVLWIGAPLPPPVPANDGIRANGNVDSVHAAPYGLAGSTVKVGVWDAGRIDAHTDFSGRLTIIDAATPVSDHSTHVAGTLGGSGALSGSRGGTPAQWRGTAPSCLIYSHDYYGDVPAEYGSAIAAYGVDLTSNSWVLDVDESTWGNCYLYGDYDGYAPEFDEVVTGYFGKRISIVVAAGNERNDGDCSIGARSGYASLPPPGTAKNVITVGAIHTNNSAMTTFSSYGPVDDGRVKPDLVAGGCQSTYDFSIWSTWPGNTYGSSSYCGTSMATPAVAGIMAVLLECRRDEIAGEPGSSSPDPLPSTLKALLLGSADDLGNQGPDFRFGYGRMNAKRAVDMLQTSTVVEDSIADGAVLEWTFPVPAGLPSLKITLVWDDPAGTPLANPALVNDLDLTLLPPSGPAAYPYVLDPGNPAAAAVTGADHRNNVEQVGVASPAQGTWTARVTGTNIPVGTAQTFSLVGIDTEAPRAPSPLTVSGATDTTLDLSWTRLGEADSRGVLLVRSDAAISWAPVDGGAYSAGQTVASGVVVVDTASGTGLTDEGLASGTRYYYRCFAFDRNRNYSGPAEANQSTTGGLSAVPLPGGAAGAFRIHPARPNPFNPSTRLRFDVPSEGPVRLDVYDTAGRLVRALVNESLPPGSYEETWDGTGERGEDAASGVYFARFTSSKGILTTRLLLVR